MQDFQAAPRSWGPSIKLEVARSIFAGVEFIPSVVDGKTVSYVAEFGARSAASSGLTRLCSRLWGDQILCLAAADARILDLERRIAELEAKNASN